MLLEPKTNNFVHGTKLIGCRPVLQYHGLVHGTTEIAKFEALCCIITGYSLRSTLFDRIGLDKSTYKVISDDVFDHHSESLLHILLSPKPLTYIIYKTRLGSCYRASHDSALATLTSILTFASRPWATKLQGILRWSTSPRSLSWIP